MVEIKILTGTANPALALSIADHLGLQLSHTLVTRFSDGEIRVQVQESVRGMDVFLVQPTCPPTSETILELLIILDALNAPPPNASPPSSPISAMHARRKKPSRANRSAPA